MNYYNRCWLLDWRRLRRFSTKMFDFRSTVIAIIPNDIVEIPTLLTVDLLIQNSHLDNKERLRSLNTFYPQRENKNTLEEKNISPPFIPIFLFLSGEEELSPVHYFEGFSFRNLKDYFLLLRKRTTATTIPNVAVNKVEVKMIPDSTVVVTVLF